MSDLSTLRQLVDQQQFAALRMVGMQLVDPSMQAAEGTSVRWQYQCVFG